MNQCWDPGLDLTITSLCVSLVLLPLFDPGLASTTATCASAVGTRLSWLPSATSGVPSSVFARCRRSRRRPSARWDSRALRVSASARRSRAATAAGATTATVVVAAVAAAGSRTAVAAAADTVAAVRRAHDTKQRRATSTRALCYGVRSYFEPHTHGCPCQLQHTCDEQLFEPNPR